MNYKLKENSGATGLTRGKVYTEKEINDLPGMGGVSRLMGHGTIEVTSEPASSQSEEANPLAPELNTGNPPPLSEDGEQQAKFKREHSPGGAVGDAAERANPPGGARGTVKKKAE